MTAPVNLNRVRKQKTRAEKAEKADQNAVRFGRSKSERVLTAAKTEKAAKMLDQHLMDDDH